MSKKDYQAVARVIHDAFVKADPGWTRDRATLDKNRAAVLAVRGIMDAVADLFAADNERFDAARFREACETGACKGMRP